ncbi:aspartyl/glutamyl-tRNA(Asn/Gln) amidotransferase subunit A [Cetobacterium ceti]|uniref:Glutamyl-tRNA(Gln) amidotransferase subunit A n=1 Tax=Cetobacterium ceti TaxID=180163 RepID=A0A1T4KL00_9FUSO|nr:Asp-tRNA(Asn)/Glu-tRNA(Gln) amidotransferase subunit GatA [Cetobacterium ceti]SJZ43080.1 aspartyl/glutamyl-tRNA(Asn/Gln) amidotransferase subunit A [Cetobacterium ceti]
MQNIYELTAFEIREKVVSGEVTAQEVVEAIFARIEKTDEKIGSFVSLRKEKALEEAKKLDEKIKAGEKLGALAGVPVAIKDNMVSYGDPATSASKILNNYIGVYDATVVTKLKEADAIIIGKTNMDEFAMGSTTKTSYHEKTTKNPWDLDRVPGGSSGGAATSIAAQQCFISLGSDTGGSIRQPASFCGVVGLKPTYGRVSRYGLMAFASSLDQIGPFAKNVKDAALAMNVLAGADEYDATAEDIKVPNYLDALTGDIKGMKIGVPKEYFIDGIRPEVREVVDKALEEFKELGAEIVEISLPHTKYAVPTYYVLAPAEASSNLARFDGVRYGYRAEDIKNIEDLYVKSRSEGFGEEVKRRIMIGTYVLSAGFFDAYFKKAQKVRRLIKNDFDEAFKNVDVIFTPVSPSTAFRLDDKKTPIELYLEDIFTISANLAGIPGLSIPGGYANGLPVGIQLLGKPFKEEDILRAGDAFERKTKNIKFPNID